MAIGDAATRLVINFELVDKATAQAQTNLRKISDESKKTNAEVKKGFENSELSLKGFERGLNAVSRSTAILGAALLGPLGLAVNSASKNNYELYSSMNQIKDATDEVIKSIGISLAPVMRDIAFRVREASNAWQNLSRDTKDNIIQTAAWVGGTFLAASVATKIVAALTKLGGLLAAPGGTIALGMAGLIASTAVVVDSWAKLNGELLTFQQRWQRIQQLASTASNPAAGIGQFFGSLGFKAGAKLGNKLGGGPGTIGDTPSVDLGSIKAPQKTKKAKDELKELGDEAKKIAEEVGNSFAIMSDTYTRSIGGVAGVTMTMLTTTIDGVTKSLGDAVAQSIVFGKDFSESIVAGLKALAAQLISFLITTIAKITILRALGVVGPIGTGSIGLSGGGGGTGGGGGGGFGGFVKSIFGFAQGGTINEPIAGIGLRSGAGYTFGENGPETITPHGRSPRGGGGYTHIEINNPVVDSDQRLNDLARRLEEKLSRLNARSVARA